MSVLMSELKERFLAEFSANIKRAGAAELAEYCGPCKYARYDKAQNFGQAQTAKEQSAQLGGKQHHRKYHYIAEGMIDVKHINASFFC